MKVPKGKTIYHQGGVLREGDLIPESLLGKPIQEAVQLPQAEEVVEISKPKKGPRKKTVQKPSEE